jgi:hypothetical protein
VTQVDSWLEVNLVPPGGRDESLLTGLVDRLVHDGLRGELETWFFFWEPELRLRLRWSDPARAEPCRATVAATLDEAVRQGRLAEWYEAAHGRRGERYEGEAEMYGAEIWPLVQKDWMNGSEFALAIAKLERAGLLSESRAFHWQRHVHLVTNQMYGTWDAEVELCLAQALGYLRHILASGRAPSEEAARLIAELAAAADR